MNELEQIWDEERFTLGPYKKITVEELWSQIQECWTIHLNLKKTASNFYQIRFLGLDIEIYLKGEIWQYRVWGDFALMKKFRVPSLHGRAESLEEAISTVEKHIKDNFLMR